MFQRPAVPPGAVVRDQPQADQRGQLLRPGQGAQRGADLRIRRSTCAETETQYAQFDQAKANALLDEVGLKKGADGFRTLPNGKPLELTVETYQTSGAAFDAIELVPQGLGKRRPEGGGQVLAARVVLAAGDWTTRSPIAVWGTDRGAGAVRRSDLCLPVRQALVDGAAGAATGTARGGQKGEKPEGDLAKALELFDQFKATTDPAKQVELGKQIVKLAARQPVDDRDGRRDPVDSRSSRTTSATCPKTPSPTGSS